MPEVFYHSVIHGLGFFICFMIYIEGMKTQYNKARFFYVLNSDKTWVVQSPIKLTQEKIEF